MSPAGNVFYIPPGLSFVDSLAKHLLARTETDPLKLAEMLVLMPNRRACRALRDSFLRHSKGQIRLLPRLRPLDSVDEDELTIFGDAPLDIPPAISATERMLLLTRLVMAKGGANPISPDQALRLANELAGLLDSVTIERLDFSKLENLVPADYASHWQETLHFLTIITQAWPQILAERGVLDAQERQNRVLDQQIRLWQSTPPQTPIIVAGAVGSRPAAMDLMKLVLALPKGEIILPGVDMGLDDESWAALDETHPQFAIAQALHHLGISRQNLRPLTPEIDPVGARVRLLSEAMKPAATCHSWANLPDFPPVTLANVTLLETDTQRQEAAAIALMMRETLDDMENPKTVALVTPDRGLADRVTAELRRFGIEVNDSNGQPLRAAPVGTFFRLINQAIADEFAPVPLLELLKHPMAGLGYEIGQFRSIIRRLDLALRGPRLSPGLGPLRDHVAQTGDEDLIRFIDDLILVTQEFVDLSAQETAPLADLIRAHGRLAEALAATSAKTGPERLWRFEAGEAMATFIADLALAADAAQDFFPPLPQGSYLDFFEQCLLGQVVRSQWGAHPRAMILGPMEARLIHCDRMILGGLNAGIWPQSPSLDPWMSRPMRQAFGLPLPEWKIGLSALDFTQAFAAPEVILTRSLKVNGTPTVPSRWLMRLTTIAKALDLSFADGGLYGSWADELDKAKYLGPNPCPNPCPPQWARPRRMSVTDIELWRRDPYSIYAKHVLKLRPLDDLDADSSAAEYGNLIHDVLDNFCQKYPQDLPENALEQLMQIGAETLAPYQDRPSLYAFWWGKFQSLAAWFIAQEQSRRPHNQRILTECKGQMTIAANGGPFVLTARADRIDLLKDGHYAILDYKTGTLPTTKTIKNGFAPQLPLEAAILQQGGFEGVPPAPVSQLIYWQLKGGTEGGKEVLVFNEDVRQGIETTWDDLKALIDYYDRPETCYRPVPYPEFAPRYNNYEHLVRIKEWSLGSESQGDGDE